MMGPSTVSTEREIIGASGRDRKPLLWLNFWTTTAQRVALTPFRGRPRSCAHRLAPGRRPRMLRVAPATRVLSGLMKLNSFNGSCP